MNMYYWKIVIPIFVILVNSYVFLGGFVKDNLSIQSKTRRIYSSLTKEITSLNGEYKQFGGQVIRGFRLDIKFENSTNDNKVILLNKIVSLGFTLKDIEDNNIYLFCKDKKGLLVAKEPAFQIEYENDMSDCKD